MEAARPLRQTRPDEPRTRPGETRRDRTRPDTTRTRPDAARRGRTRPGRGRTKPDETRMRPGEAGSTAVELNFYKTLVHVQGPARARRQERGWRFVGSCSNLATVHLTNYLTVPTASTSAPPPRAKAAPRRRATSTTRPSFCLSVAAAVRDTVQGCGIGAEITRRTARTSRACQPAPTPTAMAKSLTRDFADTRKNLKRFAPSR